MTSLATAAATGREFPSPLDASQIPTPKKTFSEYVTGVIARVTAKDPDTVNDNKQIYWQSFTDWASKNPINFRQTIYDYMADSDVWITEFFPIVISDKLKFKRIVHEVDNRLANLGVMKVPMRNIHSRTYAREKNAVYTGLSFSMDYHVMKTEDGMRAWDMMVGQITANLWGYIVYQTLHEMVFEPEYFRRTDQLYPGNDIPRNVNALFEIENRKKFVLNKRVLGQHEIVADSSRIMMQKNVECNGLILSRDTMWFMHGRDPAQTTYDKSGPMALVARGTMGTQKTVDGLTLYPVPVMNRNLHDPYFEPLLNFPVQHGSFWRFDENVKDPELYRSMYTSRRFASVTKNSMTTYTKLDVLLHSPEFYPLDYQRGGGVSEFTGAERATGKSLAGKINRDFLYSVINNRENIFRDRLRTNLSKNLDKIVLVRHNVGYTGDKEMYPIQMFGEMNEAVCKTKYFSLPATTLHRAMTEGLTKDELSLFDRTMLMIREWNGKKVDITKLTLISNGADKATADVRKRNSAKANDVGYYGINMYKPHRLGGPDFKAIDFDGAGCGNIAAIMTLIELSSTGQMSVDRSINVMELTEFVRIYKIIVANLMKCCPDHPFLSPKMIPFFHNSEEMDDSTRILIAAWYGIFSSFYTPLIFKDAVTQFTYTVRDYIIAATSVNESTPLGFAVSLIPAGGDIGANQESHIMHYLEYIHPAFLLRFSPDKNRVQEFVDAYDQRVYTKGLYDDLGDEPLMGEFPDFVRHVLANPLTNEKIDTDIQKRVKESAAKTPLVGAAFRAYLFMDITAQNIISLFENDVAIPLGALAIRPHEEQMSESVIAVSKGKIGEVNFSGIDNTISFDANRQHFDVQAFLWVAPVVSRPEKFHIYPMARGGIHLGGKGHMFINHNDDVPISENDNLRRVVSACDARSMGARSIIGVIESYNSAMSDDPHETRFDIRNTFRKENFVGRLDHSPDDFVTERPNLVYSGAPVLNALFNWDNGESNLPHDNNNFVQMMRLAQRNYHVQEGVTDVPDHVKGGWIRKRGHGVWENTEVENCRQLQSSMASPPVEYQ